MDRRRVLLVDAFTDAPLAGNVAGVVPDARDLAPSQMQAIANELGASETAFVLPSETADRHLRYFTPSTEVSLCGHATVASLSHLREAGEIEAGPTTVETGAGVLDVDLANDGRVWLAGTEPTVREVSADANRLGDVLGLSPSAREAVDDLPLAVASTGLPFLIVPVGYFADVRGADPSPAAVEALANTVEAAGIYLFTFETVGADATLHARAFVPGAGVPEDPATGTASGAAGAYLRHVDAFEAIPEEMTFEQGHTVGRPGRVSVRVDADGVRIGGRAITSLEGEITVPPNPDEDILEA